MELLVWKASSPESYPGRISELGLYQSNSLPDSLTVERVEEKNPFARPPARLADARIEHKLLLLLLVTVVGFQSLVHALWFLPQAYKRELSKSVVGLFGEWTSFRTRNSTQPETTRLESRISTMYRNLKSHSAMSRYLKHFRSDCWNWLPALCLISSAGG